MEKASGRSRGKTAVSVGLKIAIFISMVIGLRHTFAGGSFMSRNSLLFFTIQSNLWIGCWCLLFALLQILGALCGKNCIRPWMHAVKFMFTTSITLTFAVMTAMLTPVMIAQGGGAALLQPSNIFPHYVVPILSVADFFLFDTDWHPRRRSALLAVIMPLCYITTSFALGAAGVQYTPEGDTFPYFFMDYQAMGWFRGFQPDGKYGAMTLGTAWWLIILTIFVVLMGYAYIALQKRSQHSSLAQIPFT